MSVRCSQPLAVVENLQEESRSVKEDQDKERKQEGDDDRVKKPQDPGEIVNIQREKVVQKPNPILSQHVKRHLQSSQANLCGQKTNAR